MDTSKLEKQAENYIQSKLSKHDFFVSKPQYDIDGCDLQIVDNPKSPIRLIKVQSKGRTLASRTQVKIPWKYVVDEFVLFVYLVNRDKQETLLLFLPEDLRSFRKDTNEVLLSFSIKSYLDKYDKYNFEKFNVGRLRDHLMRSKIKKETSLIIDSFCLENAIGKTRKIYKNIYPDKNLRMEIDTLDLIKNIIRCYDKYRAENRIINVYLFVTPHNQLMTRFYDSLELFLDSNKIRVFEMRIDGLIMFEVEDYLKRIIDSENIILVISDQGYLPVVQSLCEEDREVVLVCEKVYNGLRNYNFEWGDISYPIGLSLGLRRDEL